MARRTISLPERLDRTVRAMAHDGESFSAAVSRLIEAGIRASEGRRPSYVGSLHSHDGLELGLRAEEFIRNPVRSDDRLELGLHAEEFLRRPISDE